MSWNIEYIKEAQRDLKRLDPYNSNRKNCGETASPTRWNR